jgi:hypothetical protein
MWKNPAANLRTFSARRDVAASLPKARNAQVGKPLNYSLEAGIVKFFRVAALYSRKLRQLR